MRRFTLVVLLALVFAPSTSAAGRADLSLSASAPGVAAIGDDVTARAVVRNIGPASANAVKLTDRLSGPLAGISATSTRGSCSVSGMVVTCALGTIKKGASVRVDITAADLAAGELANAFTVRSRRTDPVARNNAARTLTGVPRAECTLIGTARADRLVGTPGADVLCGLGGNDVLAGLDGDDVLYGGSGKDTLRGGSGDDKLVGESGKDTVDFSGAQRSVRANLVRGRAVGEGADRLNGVERLTGSRYGDVLRGSGAANVLTGGRGIDKLYGRGGRDRLLGGAGADYLSGGRGRDRLSGGSGRDRCLSGRARSC
jgi:uncharacterized repeat protein (TIGR01451 family)